MYKFAIQFYLKKIVVNMGIKLYNKVPDSINKLDNFKLFRRELKS